MIGDIACDPDSDFSPIKVYDRVTSWEKPVLRACENPPLDVMAIDNLPSLMPRESSEDFSGQLLPHLKTLTDIGDGVWARAKRIFTQPIDRIISFAAGLITGILELIKAAILAPLAAAAQGWSGFPLLCAVLGYNPIDGTPVPRTAETVEARLRSRANATGFAPGTQVPDRGVGMVSVGDGSGPLIA